MTAHRAAQTRRPRIANGCRTSGPTPPTPPVFPSPGPPPRSTPYRGLRVRLVVLEPGKWQRANIHPPRRSVRPADLHRQVDAPVRGCIVAEPVPVALDRDVAQESITAVGPPEAGALVAIEGQRLAGQRHPRHAWTARLPSRMLSTSLPSSRKNPWPTDRYPTQSRTTSPLVPWIVIHRLPLSQIDAPTTEAPRIVSPTRWKWRLYLPSSPALPRCRNSAYEMDPAE